MAIVPFIDSGRESTREAEGQEYKAYDLQTTAWSVGHSLPHLATHDHGHADHAVCRCGKPAGVTSKLCRRVHKLRWRRSWQRDSSADSHELL